MERWQEVTAAAWNWVALDLLRPIHFYVTTPWLSFTSASRNMPIICSVEYRFRAIRSSPHLRFEIAGFA